MWPLLPRVTGVAGNEVLALGIRYCDGGLLQGSDAKAVDGGGGVPEPGACCPVHSCCLVVVVVIVKAG